MADDSFDITQWRQGLSDALGELDNFFRHAEASPHQRQRVALFALAKTVTAVSELPGMKDRIGPLFSLLFAYQALVDTGKSDPLLVSYVKTRGGRQLAKAHSVVQGRSAAFVELMIESGWQERQAVEHVTGLLVEAGVKGKRGKPVTKSTLRQWRANANSGDYPETSKHLRAAITNLQAMFRDHTGRWPPSKEEIALIVNGIPDIQIFRDFAAMASSSVDTD